jgi:hypothetical protein
MRFFVKYRSQLNWLGIFIFGILAVLAWVEVAYGSRVHIVHGILFTLITAMKIHDQKQRGQAHEDHSMTREKITSK